MNTVNRERVELWVAALESEGYVQCKGSLVLRGGPIPGTRHCALGVGMAVAALNGCNIPQRAWGESHFPQRVATWYGLGQDPYLNGQYHYKEAPLAPAGPIPLTVVLANDEMQASFWDIAQMIRETYLKD